jgi:hypothetical protein
LYLYSSKGIFVFCICSLVNAKISRLKEKNIKMTAVLNGCPRIYEVDAIEKRRERFNEFVSKLVEIARSYGYLAPDAGERLQHLKLLETASKDSRGAYIVPYSYSKNGSTYKGKMYFDQKFAFLSLEEFPAP